MAHKLRILAVAGLLGLCGCGESSAPPPKATPTATSAASTEPSVSIDQIERENARARRRKRLSVPQVTDTPVPVTTVTVTPVTVTRAFIPFPAERRAEMAAYAQRHYGIDSYRLDPKVIVEHFTATDTAQAAIDIFTNDVPDTELHELPATCAHYLIDRDGTILQLVPVRIMCRHTVGLNYAAIGIEHVGTSDAEVLGNAAQMKASLALTRELMARFGIARRNVIGHNESLTSPYHRENVPALRTQTHEDFSKSSMDTYRARLGG